MGEGHADAPAVGTEATLLVGAGELVEAKSHARLAWPFAALALVVVAAV